MISLAYWAASAPAAYADHAIVDADALIQLPDEIDDATGAAITLKGLTAHYLVRSAFPVQSGQTILAHAAAGGVGLLLIQMAKRLGARVIGTVGSDAKAELRTPMAAITSSNTSGKTSPPVCAH